jgi:hypothetical protein
MTPHHRVPDTVAELRAWARGVYATEAAVELLVRFEGGRLAHPRHPWIMPDLGESWYWLEPDHLTGLGAACLSGGVRRLLAIVASLTSGAPVDLGDALAGLDRDTVTLVLAAVAHASGSHEHADMLIDPDRGVGFARGRLPSLYPWPKTTREVSS